MEELTQAEAKAQAKPQATQVKPQEKPQVTIIGFGRFGQLWASIIKSDFRVKVYDPSKAALEQAASLEVEAANLEDALAADVIFYCVPISQFARTLADHAAHFKATSASKLLIDLLSVKVHAKETFTKELFTKELPENFEAMLCHPLFGPDSVNEFGLAGQRIVIEQFRARDETFNFWKSYFNNLKLEVLEMTAEEHDKQMAYSQALTHLVGRILSNMHLSAHLSDHLSEQVSGSQLDTTSSRKLFEVSEQVSKDQFQLFLDMQRYNPYTRAMREKFALAQAEIYEQIDDS